MLLRRRCLVAALVCCLRLGTGVQGSPSNWVSLSPTDCLSEPSSGRGIHGGSPTDDSGTTFIIKDAVDAGAPVTTVCPGRTYYLDLTFGSPRRALLTTTSGTLNNASSGGSGCPNRDAVLSQSARITDRRWDVPCNVQGPVTLRAISASGSGDRWKRSSISMSISNACAAPACASSASIPGALPAPSPAAAPGATPAPSAPAACTPSPMGYDCMRAVGKVIVHWSLPGRPMPSNPCTGNNPVDAHALHAADTLHMAVQAPVTGYVALAFAKEAGVMVPADMILGFMENGRPNVASYWTLDNIMDAKNKVALWAYKTNVVFVGGNTVMCFSRKLVVDAALAKVSANLTATNSKAHAGHGRRRLAQAGVLPPLQLNWAVSNEAKVIVHKSGDAGGFVLDVATGGVVSVNKPSKKRDMVVAHGIVGCVTASVFFPLGALMPAHRWFFGEKPSLLGKARWFWLHMSCQVLGCALYMVAIVLGWVHGYANRAVSDGRTAHSALSIVLLAGGGVQLGLGIIRPGVQHVLRRYWNWLHHTVGYLFVVVMLAEMYLGIWLFQNSPWASSAAYWLGPSIAVPAAIALLGLVLWVVGRKRVAADLSGEVAMGDGETNPVAAFFLRPLSRWAGGSEAYSSHGAVPPVLKA